MHADELIQLLESGENRLSADGKCLIYFDAKKTKEEMAAETWDKIRDLTSRGNGKTSDFIAIILAAFEEVLEQNKKGKLK